MAVVQISKIQIRRGKKNSTTGVPQLSSGELAWAVDSQELYIGNGSVAEGSPAVGNSKVLTEHDNLLELLGGYRFADNYINSFPYSITRSLQSKLDEIVSVKDFGAVGDGIIDDTAAFQAAVERLFLSTDTQYFKKLLVPVGTYLIGSDLYLPTNTVLVGESSQSILVLGSTLAPANIYFENINGDRDGDATWQSGTMPVNVLISNLSIDTSNGTVDISGLNHSTFEHVTFTGSYTFLGDEIIKNAVYFNNTDFGTQTNWIDFVDCKFNQVDVGVKMVQADTLETIVKFTNCEFSVVGRGTWSTGVAGQRNLWSYNGCKFNEIAKEAIWNVGSGAKVNFCTFTRCGNGANGDTLPYTAIVRFDDQNGDNIVNDCSFTRTQALMDVLTASTPCVPEVMNGTASLSNRLTKAIANPLGFLTVFSSDITKLEIDYTLTLTAGTRVGKLSIDVDKANEQTVISDDYSYTGTNTAIMEGFTFNTTFGDYDTPTDSIKETLMLSYTSGATGTINFVVRYSV